MQGRQLIAITHTAGLARLEKLGLQVPQFLFKIILDLLYLLCQGIGAIRLLLVLGKDA